MTATIVGWTADSGQTLSADTTGTTITATFQDGQLTLAGSDTLSDYQTVLQTISYQNGSTNLDGAVRQIQVVACDGISSSPVATANITLLAQAVPPAAVDITATTNKDADLDIPLLADNADPSPGDTIQVTQVDATSALGVPLTLEDDGSVDYACTQSAALATLTAGQSVTDTFDYTITDARGLTSTGQVTVAVTGQNDPPQAAGIPDVAHAVGGPATTIGLTQYFSDEQDAATALTYSVADVSNPALFSSVSIDPTSQLLTLAYARGVRHELRHGLRDRLPGPQCADDVHRPLGRNGGRDQRPIDHSADERRGHGHAVRAVVGQRPALADGGLGRRQRPADARLPGGHDEFQPDARSTRPVPRTAARTTSKSG